MSTGDIQKTVQGFFNLKQGGAIGIFSTFVATIVIILQLPPEAFAKLKQVWWVIPFPTLIMLFALYLEEHKNRTKVEVQITEKLDRLAEHFEHLFSHHLEDRLTQAKEFEQIADRFKALDERIERIYFVLEKRQGGYTHHQSDTERFLHPKQRKE